MEDTRLPFTKVENRRRAAEVMLQLAAAIRSGIYAVGDRLPPERELAVRLGVSRTSVREGLALLHLEGIVERRVGSGTYVCSTDAAALARATAAMQESEDPYEVFEWQQVVEPAMTELALHKLRQGELRRLRDALRGMREAVESGDRRAYSLADRRFHHIVAEAARNGLVVRQVSQLFQWMSHQTWRGMKQFGVDEQSESSYLRESLRFHEALYEAIANRDVAAVHRSYRERAPRIRAIVFGDAAEGE